MRQVVLFYRSLTGAFDLRGMCDRAIGYGKLVYVSAAALALTACARMQVSDPTMFSVEPVLGEGPQAAANPPQIAKTSADRMGALEAQIAELSSNVADLRKALDMLDEQAKPTAAPVQATFIETANLPPDPVSQLYALPPPMAQTGKSLFFEAKLGAFQSKDAAEDCWRRLAGEASMADLNPRFTVIGAETSLAVGPLLSEAAVNTIKVDASAISGPCRGLAPLRAY